MFVTPHADDHQWHTASSHRTSDGLVTYQRCRCGRWRIRINDGSDRVMAEVLRPPADFVVSYHQPRD
jgi:hypothetical protein